MPTPPLYSTPLPTLTASDALLIVDVQNDFLPGGALGVSGGDVAALACQRFLAHFAAQGRPVVLSRDWHPADHCSFKPQGGPWPSHCVADTPGAQFARCLELPADTIVVSKATTPKQDAYSAFDCTELSPILQKAGISHLYVCGLATDYCVLASVEDARRLGYEVTVLREAVAAVNVDPHDGARAMQTMRAAGAVLLPT